MTFQEIVDKVKKEFGSADVSNYEDHLAIQINITGEGEGAFYVEIKDGNIAVEPYDYADNNAVFTAAGDDIISLFSGKLREQDALESGKLNIQGDMAKAFSIQPVIDGNKKPSKTKRASSKAKSVKEEIEKEVKKTTSAVKSAAKTAAKTTKAAAKTAAAKAESKAATKTVKSSATKTTTGKAAKSPSKKG